MINKLIWLSLDHETRRAIAKDFGMAKTEPVEVVDGKVISDGYSDKSLMTITEKELDKRLLRTQSVLPQEFMNKWEYYVADIKMSLGKEEIKYSDNEGLNDAIKSTEKVVLDKLEDDVNPPKIETDKPKKMGRPKGSKNKK
jgi:hypothetical protein